MSSPIQIDSSGENSPSQNLVSSFSVSLSDSLSLMEEETLAHVHRARISKVGDVESSSVKGSWSDRNLVETGTSKAAGSSILGPSFHLGAWHSRERTHRNTAWSAGEEDSDSFGCRYLLRADRILRDRA
ncbi:unnamed protein product [Arabis nemorensis]|uniref:Uncharacterized protein n=1 Tax=Arabis nemorensis TaxID=586526 RepID=A0A565BAY2_9BRAS|nr:unnamed protein product [Arabis nemorensis]